MSETRIDPSVKPSPNVQPGEGGPAAQAGDAARGPRADGANPAHAHADNGRGHAHGHTNKPARVREIESQSRLVRSKLDGPPRATHGNAGASASKLLDGPQRGGREAGLEHQHGTNAGRHPSHAHGGHEPRGRAEGWLRRGVVENPPATHAHGGGRSHARGASHDVLPPRAHAPHPLVSTARDYLHGLTRGETLSPEMRQILDGAAGFLGRDFIDRPGHGVAGKRGNGLAERVLSYVGRQLEKASGAGGPSPHQAQELVRAGVREILEAARLGRHFDELGKRGGDVVRQAEAAVARALYGGPEADDGSFARILPHEVLRDLRSGAFSRVEETYSPFPLTGRARVFTEMMELMRVLDAVERARWGGAVAPGEGPDALLLSFLRGEAAPGALDDLLASLLPTLPGRAARLELLRFVAALDGALADAQGRQLAAKDGTPLKLERLLWLGLPSGLSQSSFTPERSPVPLSPLLIYGFDALYSVIGFDGRTVVGQHFAAVQAQVNGSDMEWVFGQPPLTEGWMRALIERLKDSALADHNMLGEMLEEALAEGRLHAVLVSGKVEEGEPVAGSFSVSGLLPGASAGAAFSPA